MTSNEIVTQLRRRLNKLNPTAALQDAEIWTEFTLARSRVYKNMLSRRSTISRLAYHRVCIELEDASENDCCVDGCAVKRSKHQLPSYLHTSSSSTLKVSNVKNQPLSYVSIDCVSDNMKYMPGYKNEIGWDIINGYLYIFNSPMELVQMEAIWSNPLDLLFIQKCTTATCLQDSKELIQIDEALLLDMFNIVINSLYPSLQIPIDVTGDNSEKS